MGWSLGECAETGRAIGYSVEAECDHEGCEEKIDRGLYYACGGQHGYGTFGCNKYVCEKHLGLVETTEGFMHLCVSCAREYEDDEHKDTGDKGE